MAIPLLRFIESLNSKHQLELIAAVMSAIRAGEKIQKLNERQELSEKDDEFVGHHAVVTEADNLAQDEILAEIERYLPQAKIIAEEMDLRSDRLAPYRERFITAANLSQAKTKVLVIADPLDGTAQYAQRTGAWGVSVGVLDCLKHVAGAVYAPACNFRESGEGALFFAAADTRAFVVLSPGLVGEANFTARVLEVSLEPVEKKRFVYYGVDTPFASPRRFLAEYVGRSWTASTHGSCALGLALLAAGVGHVAFQPGQRVWDWAAGKLILERAGGVFLPYEISSSREASFRYQRIESLTSEHYNPERKSIGFIAAGDEIAAEQVFELLRQCAD